MEKIIMETKSISFKIINSEKKIFDITFSIDENKLEILINEKSSIPISYKTALELQNFQQINKFFRQFDNIAEIYEFLMSLENPEEKIKIKSENKFAYLEISLPNIIKLKENNIKIKIPQIELKQNDLVIKLCEQVNKIDVLESKIDFLFQYLGKTEKDFFYIKNLI